jgi:hypothetical protein
MLGLLAWAAERWSLDFLKRCAGVLIACVFAWVFLREKAWSDTHYKIFGTPQHMEEGLRWLDANAPKGRLVVSISAPATQMAALETDSRSLVTSGSPSYASPVSTERILRGLAAALKTAGADPEKFLRERWDESQAKDTLKQQTAYFNRDVSPETCENGTWPVFMLDTEGFRPEAVQSRRQEILRYYAEEGPADGPFWL